MVAGDLTVHREVDVQENYGSPVGSQNQFDMAYYTGELITLKVRDLEGLSSASTNLFTIPEHMTLSEFVHDVGVRFNVPSNQFDLVYQDLQRGEIVRSEFYRFFKYFKHKCDVQKF
ncbi:unnamed protein product [Allacma fusca]|uniref:Uncharacterized protein n=1 Tax=Allacma fusca TaxID=39272 RepID=A0A8J2JZJ8_9HEXA|nr:unnamed protein product [Allacma fusca]